MEGVTLLSVILLARWEVTITLPGELKKNNCSFSLIFAMEANLYHLHVFYSDKEPQVYSIKCFLLICDLFKYIMWLDIPQLKLRNMRWYPKNDIPLFHFTLHEMWWKSSLYQVSSSWERIWKVFKGKSFENIKLCVISKRQIYWKDNFNL